MSKVIFLIVAIYLMIAVSPAYSQSTAPVMKEGFIEVTGGQVWYRIIGSGERTPLLILHGGPGLSSIYLKPLEALATNRSVIFYDQLGCGNSSAPTDTTSWTIEHFVEEISQVRKALGLKEIHLYGHSWGALLSVEHVLAKPAGIRSIILASPCISVPQWVHDADSLLGTLPDSLQEIIRYHERENTTNSPEFQSSMMTYYGKFLARKQPWSNDLNSAFEQMNQAMSLYMWGPSEFACTGILKNHNRADRLGEIMIPTLFTVGQFDQAAPSTVGHYQSLVPGSTISVLKSCGHLTMHDDPATNVEVINDFLFRVESE